MTTANEGQWRSWGGDGGDFWAAHADRFDGGVAGYGEAFRSAAAVRPGERVLDVGCGAGTTTIEAAAAAAPDGTAHGIDLSAALLELARRRAADAGVPATFAVADAQTADLPAVDVVLSRNGVMFFDDPAAAFANLHRAVTPGGRILFQVWQALAEQEWLWAVHAALRVPDPPETGPGPLALADPGRCRDLLGGAGFTDIRIDDVRSPMWFGDDVEQAAAFHLDRVADVLASRPDAERAADEAALRRVLAEHEGPDGVRFRSAAWLVRATRP